MRSTTPPSQPTEPQEFPPGNSRPRHQGRRHRTPAAEATPFDARLPRKARPRAAGRPTLMARFAPLAFIVLTAGLAARIGSAISDYRDMQARVASKQIQLKALEAQHEVGTRRLAVLRADETHKSVLVEHGYIKPGDRILLFPRTAEEERAARLPKNDLAPHDPIMPETAQPSLWQRATGWLRPAPVTSSPSPPAPVNSTSPAAASTSINVATAPAHQ